VNRLSKMSSMELLSHLRRCLRVFSGALLAASLLVLTPVAYGDDPGDYTELCHSELHDCEEESSSPGCNEPTCCKTICALEPFCCEVSWAIFCAAMATEFCEPPLPCPNGGSCFEVGDPEEPGCDDGECCALVCGLDSYCCNGYWDGACVELALASCLQPVCELPPPGPDEILEPEECAERINEGCNFANGQFIDIYLGDKYRSTVYAGAPRDTDWYRFEVDQPGEYAWTVTSEFPSTVLVMTGECSHGLLVVARGYGGDCSPISVPFDAAVGTYYLFVSPGTPAGPLRRGVRCPPDDDEEDPIPTHFGIEYIAHLTSQHCQPTTSGDLNNDGVVDGSDLLVLLQNWGECSDPQFCAADFNCDGTVDGQDLLTLLSDWG
jgi:hypothetical protein